MTSAKSTTAADQLATLTWPAAFAAGPEECGGKGHNLGRAARYGFRVPPGGVLPAAWYSEIMRRVPATALAVVERASAEEAGEPAVVAALSQIRGAIEGAELPFPLRQRLTDFLESDRLSSAWVAVRSSATMEDGARASFAGIHRSTLNVRGADGIERAILDCHASLWTPQALAYRRKMGFTDGDVRCAVVICAMVHAAGTAEPHCAGVGFTFDPMTGRRDRILIDAALGSGENVVGGVVAPQRIAFQVECGRLHFAERGAGAALLPPERERELAHLLFRIHWAFGDGQDPQDVEWAYDGEQIWILQVRPATQVRRCVPPAVGNLPRYWSTANIKDAVPGVLSTLSWSLLKGAVDRIAFGAPIAAGYQLPAGVELVRRFQGRGYFELTLMQWVMYDSLAVPPAQVVRLLGGRQPEIPVPNDRASGPAARRRLLASLRLLKNLLGIQGRLNRVNAARQARIRGIRDADLTKVPSSGLLQLFEQLTLDFDGMDVTVALANSASGPWELALEAALKPAFGERARALLGSLLAGSGAVTSAEHGYAIHRLAALARQEPKVTEWLESGQPATSWSALPDSPFRQELAHFLELYGHRAVYEADYLNPRWAEDPTYILDQVRFAIANPQPDDPRSAARCICEEAERVVRRECGWRARPMLWLAGKLRSSMALREAAKSALLESALPSKYIALEIGQRLAGRGYLDDAQQVHHLSLADLLCLLEGWWNGEGAAALAADRARQREQWLAEETPPDLITEASDGRLTEEPETALPEGDEWSGIGAAPGLARGLARIVMHPNDAHSFKVGEVLVAPSTDPGWTPLFLRASAIVMASGGYLSHGAIVAREYGIPAVVNVPGILTLVQPGDRLLVDGDAGRVVRERSE